MRSLGSLEDDRLAAAIRTAGRGLRWPVTPDIAAAVRREIDVVRPRAGMGVVWPAMPRRRRLVLLIVAALVLLGGAAFAAKLVVDIGVVTIEAAPGLPTASSTTAGLGSPVPLEDASRLTGIRPRYPDALGRPDDVWVDEGPVGPEGGATRWIAMAWQTGPDLRALGDTARGAVLIQFHGEAGAAFKTVYAQAGSIRFVDLDGREAAWITGPHELRLSVGGELRTFHVDGNVLIWQDGDDTFRFESGLPLARARGIAESVPA